MTKKVATVRGDDSVEKVCDILCNNELSGVPVIDKKKKLVGYISEKDIIASLSKKKKSKKVKVKDIMNKKVCSVKENETVAKCANIFIGKPYRKVPVIKAGKLVGIVSRQDIMSRLVEEYY